jgi:TolB-like protein
MTSRDISLRKWGKKVSRHRFSVKTVFFLLAVFLILPSLVSAKEVGKNGFPSGDTKFRIAIFPVENLSGTPAPLKEIRQALIERLNKQGFEVLGDENLEKFMAKHRIRYVGGLDRGIAKAFKEEMGIEGVLITSLEFYSETDPPKVALTSRLISTGEAPSILWIDGIGLAGDDSPGILGLGLIEGPKALLEKAMKSVTDSLIRYLLTRRDEGKGRGAKKKFRPKVAYRSPELDPERKYVMAILPFFNRSERRYAGEILVLHFIRQLRKFNNFDIIEPGILRQELLGLRVIMEDGVSLANADAIFSVLDADVIVSGKVIDYQDYQGLWGKPKVDFSTVLIERKSRQVVWGSNSYNEGDDGVFFFDRGKVNTAYVMASQMVRWIGEWVVKKR